MFGFFTQRVYLQLFAAYALGVALMFRTPLPREMLTGWEALLIWGVLGAIGALAWLHREGRPGRIALFALVIAGGALNVSLFLRPALDMELRELADGTPQTLYGKVASIPKYQRGHMRFILEVDEMRDDLGFRPMAGRCFVFLKCDADTELYLTDRVRIWASLKEVAPPANRGQFNYRRYLLQRGTTLTAYVPTERSLRRLRDAPPQPWALLSAARKGVLSAVTEGLPPHLGQLAASVVYGDKVVELPADLQDRWRRAGLTHIVVASGTQVSLIIAVLALLLWRIGDNASWRGRLLNLGQFAVMLGAVIAYAAITGFETSIVRALVMGGVVLVGRLVSRQTDGLTALAQAGLIVLLMNPMELLAAGFQLSFGATFGLIYCAGVLFPLTAQLAGWRLGLAQMFITTAGAQTFVAPLLAAQFNQLSAWGLVSNLLAIPLSFFLLIIGAVASLGGVYVPGLGALLTWTVLALSWIMDLIAIAFAALPGSNIAVPTPPWWWIALCYLLLLAAGEWIKAERTGRAGREGRAPAVDLSQHWRNGLRIGVPALVLLMSIGVGMWLVVPRPELIVLHLPRSEGYLWRSAAGRNVLLLRSAGLRSNHNADTVEAALRSRGINKLHGIVWLDKPPVEPLLPDYSGPLLSPGAELDSRLDMEWVNEEKRVVGCRLGRGAARLDVLWQTGATPAADPAASLAAVSPRVWRDIPRLTQDELIAAGRVVPGMDGVVERTELHVDWPRLRVTEYVPPGP